MCLAIPGKIISIDNCHDLMRNGKVSFEGIVKDISLAMVPDADVGDYVIVHAGFAISMIDEAEAVKVFEMLREAENIDEVS